MDFELTHFQCRVGIMPLDLCITTKKGLDRGSQEVVFIALILLNWMEAVSMALLAS